MAPEVQAPHMFVCHIVQETTGVHSVTHLLWGCAAGCHQCCPGNASSLGAVLWFAQQLRVSVQEGHYAAAPVGGVTTCPADSAIPLSLLQRHVFSHYVIISTYKGGFLVFFSALCKSISHQSRINLIA